MPRKAAKPAATAADDATANPPAEGTSADNDAAAEPTARRSSRLASQVAVNPPPPAAPKPKRGGGGRKRAAAEVSGNEEVSGENKDAGDEAEKDPNAMEVDAPEGEKEEGSGTKKRARKAPAKAADEEDASSSTPSLPELNIGDPLPSLILKNEKDEDIQVADLVDEQNGVILFLVPKADTPGCTSQACGFRDAYPDFTGVNFRVYCLSADAPTAQAKWQTKKSLPYPLISDPKRILISALGAGEGGKTKRSHFIFGPKKDESGGKLLDKKIPVKPLDSPKLALEFIKSL